MVSDCVLKYVIIYIIFIYVDGKASNINLLHFVVLGSILVFVSNQSFLLCNCKDTFFAVHVLAYNDKFYGG